jgi:adenylate kinase family enzyme
MHINSVATIVIYSFDKGVFMFFKKNVGRDNLIIGYNSRARPIILHAEDRRKGLGVFGTPGSGKTFLLENLAKQQIANHRGLLCIDGHTSNEWGGVLSELEGNNYKSYNFDLNDGVAYRFNVIEEIKKRINNNTITHIRMKNLGEEEAKYLLDLISSNHIELVDRKKEEQSQQEKFMVILDGFQITANNSDFLNEISWLMGSDDLTLIVSSQRLDKTVFNTINCQFGTLITFRQIDIEENYRWNELLLKINVRLSHRYKFNPDINLSILKKGQGYINCNSKFLSGFNGTSECRMFTVKNPRE